VSDASSPGLLDSLRRLGATALETVQVRADLLAVELEQEKRRLLGALLLGAMALLLLGVGLVLMVGLLLLLLQEAYRVAALALLTLGFLGAGLALVQRARRQLETPGGMAAGSRGEIARDRQALAGAAREPGGRP
jgi:uncharacterized membrane protein YqjE